MKISKKLTLFFKIILLVSLCTFFYSLTMPAYSNYEKFNNLYMKIDNDSAAFHKLREAYLTPAYKICDYSLTVALLSLSFLALVGILRKNPKGKFGVILTGVMALAATFAASLWSTFQSMYRTEVPHWADSPGIPLMGSLMILFILGIWMGVNCLFLRGDFYGNVNIFSIPLRKWNPWLGFIVIMTILVIALVAFDGTYEYIIPGTLWMHFYLSLNAGRRINL